MWSIWLCFPRLVIIPANISGSPFSSRVILPRQRSQIQDPRTFLARYSML